MVILTVLCYCGNATLGALDNKTRASTLWGRPPAADASATMGASRVGSFKRVLYLDHALRKAGQPYA